MATFNAYLDLYDAVQNATMNVETASLVGGFQPLASLASAGATSLTAQAYSYAPYSSFSTTSNFDLFILDGPQSERIAGCSCSGSTLTVPAPGTTYAHAAGVTLASPGTNGCLAAVIRDASATLESICRQGPDGGTDRSLWNRARTDVLSWPNRALFDRDSNLLMRPFHLPVTAVSSVSIQILAQSGVGIDTTYLVIADSGRTVLVPVASGIGTPPISIANQFFNPFPRNRQFWATLNYTGGPIRGTTLDSVPSDLRRACALLVQDELGYRQNPGGFASVRLGDKSVEARLRGDTDGKSLLYKQAVEMLAPYIRTM